jgi:hypothetical protein
MRRPAMFEKEDALPGAELQAAVGDRDHFARAGQDGTDVRSAVVGAFRGVFEVGGVLGHEALEKFLQVAPRGWIRVFHDDQAATGVPNEDGNGAGFHPALRDHRRDAIGDFVGALPARGESNAGGVNRHDGGTLRPAISGGVINTGAKKTFNREAAVRLLLPGSKTHLQRIDGFRLVRQNEQRWRAGEEGFASDIDPLGARPFVQTKEFFRLPIERIERLFRR